MFGVPAPSEIYSRLMINAGHGYPLYSADHEGNETLKSENREIQYTVHQASSKAHSELTSATLVTAHFLSAG